MDVALGSAARQTGRPAWWTSVFGHEQPVTVNESGRSTFELGVTLAPLPHCCCCLHPHFLEALAVLAHGLDSLAGNRFASAGVERRWEVMNLAVVRCH